jgi:quercetin dioxygenase-like cupin family protein
MHDRGMSTANNSRIALELESGADPIRGLIEHADGSRQPFWGWLELIEELRRIAADEAERPSPPTPANTGQAPQARRARQAKATTRNHRGATMRTTSRKSLALAGAGTTIALAAAAVALATPPSGETPTPLARGQLAPAKVNRSVTGGRVKIQTHGALDALMLNITLAPGGNGGWHSHAGSAITIVKQGTVTIIDAKCQRHDVPAGHAVISDGSSPTENENRGTTPVVVYVMFLLPHSASSPRIDQPAPVGCTA